MIWNEPNTTSNFNIFQTHEVFLKDKNSHLMIITIIGRYLSSRLIFKKKKHVREFIKDYFQTLWFPHSRNHFSWLLLVLSNQRYEMSQWNFTGKLTVFLRCLFTLRYFRTWHNSMNLICLPCCRLYTVRPQIPSWVETDM